eukprot:5703957-Amphidinium_carterae.1
MSNVLGPVVVRRTILPTTAYYPRGFCLCAGCVLRHSQEGHSTYVESCLFNVCASGCTRKVSST